jgi:hypothetical protein
VPTRTAPPSEPANAPSHAAASPANQPARQAREPHGLNSTPPARPAATHDPLAACDVEATSTTAARIDWATLLKRIYDVDALACPCGGRLRFIALIVEPTVAAAILDALQLPSTAPPIARARSPSTFDLYDADADADADAAEPPA